MPSAARSAPLVIGSYRMTNFKLEEIPPGVIDHKEWTPDNGRNNALRIKGLGAPRAFYTPIIRGIKFPNVSYGEDYAAVLAVSPRVPDRQDLRADLPLPPLGGELRCRD